MGMFSRLADVINANINSLLDKAEDPEKMLRMIIQEMEETLVDVRTSAAKNIAEKKTAYRKISSLKTQASQWQQKAELALQKGRDDLARAALVEKQKAQQEFEAMETDVAKLDEGLAGIQQDCQRLQEKLTEARRKQQSFAMRQNTSSARLKIKQKEHQYDIESALAKFENYQRKIDDMEAQVEAYDMTESAQDLNAQFRELEANDSVEQELEQMRKKVANG